ncbi:hypothetical protein F1559_003291 [Cyanidiococcus yangmingshanensis]|uniref:Mediator of RNA polymerase II transcription subunit 14 n=1 Tax=Cyanidiococcus yangmingshanensis TaxID=2690220 RepID=A0A7J7IF37_9RHOD|nr:hypothetical protein F1559_003291 [Cyanidiococcus yangmingshanensis]
MALSGTEAPVPTVDTVEAAFPAVSFPSLCESVAEFGYVALRDLVEQLVEQRSDDVDAAEKNVLVIDVSQRERHRLLRLLTLFRWLRGSYTTLRQAQVCVIEADWLANRFERTGADVLWSMHQQLRAGPLFAAAMDVPAAATVAATGTYDRLPLVLHLAKSSAIPQLRHQAIRILGTRTCLLLREAASTMHVQLQFSPCNETEASRAFVAVSDRNMRGWRAVVGLRPVSPSMSLPPLQATSMKQAEWDWVVSKVTLDGDAANAPLAASVVQGRYVNICRKKQVVEFAEKTRYFLGCLVSCLSVELCEPLRVVSLASSIETLVKDQSDAASNGFQGRATVGTPSTIRVRRLGPHHAHFQVLYWPTSSKPSVALDLVQAENRWWHAISVQCTHLEVPPTPEWLWDPNYRLQGPLHGYVRIGHQPPLPTDASVDMAHIETGDGVGLLVQVRRARAHALLRTIASELPLSIRKQLMYPCSLDLRLPGAGDLTVHVQVEEQDGVVCVRVGADDVLTSIRNVGGYVDPLVPGWLRIETWPAWLPISEQRQRILIRLEALQRHALSDQVRVLADLCSWYPHPVYLMPGANRLELAVKLSSGSYFVPIGHVLAALAGHREESVQGSRWTRIVAYTVDALRRVEYLTSLMRESGVLDEDRTPDIIPWSTAVALIRGRAERLIIPLRMRTYEGLTIHHSWLHIEAACPDRSPWSVELEIATDLFDSCTDSTAIDGESSAGRIVVESTRAPRGIEEPTPVPSAIVGSPKATSVDWNQ